MEIIGVLIRLIIFILVVRGLIALGGVILGAFGVVGLIIYIIVLLSGL